MTTAFDFLILGSGVAGLTFALEAAEHGRVMLVTKKQHTESNTNYAQGGIAAVLGTEDSFEQHIQDTLRAGAGLCDRRAVEAMVREGPERIRSLMDLGVEFTTYWKGRERRLALAREGGHTADRIVHRADHTGQEVEQRLVQRCLDHPFITVVEHSTAVDLAVESKGGKRRVVGAFVLNQDGEMEYIPSRITMLATGGCGQVYLHTTNPGIATGDGLAMAYRAGAPVANLEFMQFHPTTLYPRTDQAFLISEAVRGFGAVLRTSDGEAFMSRYHPMADLAPRDIVARAIDHELKVRGDDFVYLDATMRHPDEIRERFPNIYRHCLSRNLDITREWIPVVPAAHYMCGGVITDLHGRTGLPGLFAAGEVTWSGVHGANRLASNSLLEAVVFSHRAAAASIRALPDFSPPSNRPVPPTPADGYNEEEWVLVSHDRFQIRKIMWDYVGIVRSDLRLLRARRRIALIRGEIENLCRRAKMTTGLVELRNIALAAELIIRSAQKRRESRGLHYTTDYPHPDASRPPRITRLVNRSAR